MLPLVLVVDDSQETRESIAIALGDHDFHVKCAANGREALELLDGGLIPDVMLVDLEMPEMGGMALLDAVATRPDLAGVPAIVVSGMPPTELPPGTRWLGKFASLEYLIATVRGALSSQACPTGPTAPEPSAKDSPSTPSA